MRKVFWITVIFLISIPAIFNLLHSGYFSMHDDLQIMRIWQMEKCFSDGQIPCRWSPDMGYGFGQPMFNFYSATPYYLGQLIRILTPLSIIWTAKSLFVISLVASGVGMFYLSRKFFGNMGGVLSAVLYVYAPYHSVDIYVRGALSELFALALLPFLWLAIYLTIKEKKLINVISLSVVLGLQLGTHNVSTMMYVPFSAAWTVFWLLRFRKNFKFSLINLALGGVLGFGLAAFFILPVFLEKPLIQSEFLTVNYLSYKIHFTNIKQLFLDRHWDWGPSLFGPDDQMSFQLGWPHWILGVLAGLIALKRKNIMVLLLLGMAGFAAFLTHGRSEQIWIAIPVMEYIQFPWRFLGLAIFLLSFASGSVLIRFKLLRFYMLIGLIFITIALNLSYFRPKHLFYDETDKGKLSGENLIVQKKSAILDYLPTTAKRAPEIEAGGPNILKGEGIAENYTTRSNFFFLDAQMFTEGTVEIPVTYFPGWIVTENGQEIPIRPDGEIGIIHVDLKPGKHMLQGRFTNTPVRSLGNVTTAISFFVLLGLFVRNDMVNHGESE